MCCVTTGTQELIEEIGIDEQYLLDTLNKFEKLRIALFGDCIDWQGLVYQEMRNVAERERELNKNNEDFIRHLENERRKLTKEIKSIKEGKGE